MVPAKWRKLPKRVGVAWSVAEIQRAAGAIEIAAIEQDDGCGHEVERCGPGLLVLVTAIAEPT